VADALSTERVQYLAARLAAHLPDRAKVWLSGEPPVVVDGQRLDPQLQLIRSVQRRRRIPGLLEPTIARGRARYRRQTQAFRGPRTEVGSVRDFEIPAGSHRLAVRHYIPANVSSTPRPLTVYLHGGGFVIGDLDTHDEPCRVLCRAGEVQVLSVAYRLAPENPFPAAVDDARAALAWARQHAGELGADPGRVGIGGDSAGGNLAAVVSALEPPQAAPFAQLLIYPATDMTTKRPSQQLFADGFFLTRRDLGQFLHHYAGAGQVPPDDPRLSPLHATLRAALPRALVVLAGFDVLRDEGEAYGQALERSGTSVILHRCPSLGHGFIHLTGVCPAAKRAATDIARRWGSMLATRETAHA
jgi:acetyl esterase